MIRSIKNIFSMKRRNIDNSIFHTQFYINKTMTKRQEKHFKIITYFSISNQHLLFMYSFMSKFTN